MGYYFLNRLFQSICVLLLVTCISFSLFQFIGDPVTNLVGQESTMQERADIRAQLGLDDTILEQYVRFLARIARFDFGLSYQLRRPVSVLIAERLPATVELVLCSALLSLVLGVSSGVLISVYHNRFWSSATMIISLLGVSLPTFVIGVLLIYIFSVRLDWLPSFGRGEVVKIGFWTTGFLTSSGIKALILPSLTLGLFQMTYIIRLVRAEMLNILRAEYIRFAKARGLSFYRIHFKHALRNAWTPVITIVSINIGGLLAFSVITETVFQWPGMGLLFIQAVNFVDIPVMSAYLAFIALVFVGINFFVDTLYFILDPRLRSSSGENGSV